MFIERLKNKVNGMHADFLGSKEDWARTLMSASKPMKDRRNYYIRERFNSLIATFRNMHGLMFVRLP